MPKILIASKHGVVVINGSRRMVRRGRTTAHAGHPIVEKHPHLWEPIHVDYPLPDTAPEDQAEGVADEPPEGEQPDTDSAEFRAAVRAWAAENDIEVSPRGKIPAAVVDQYLEAQRG